MQFCFIVDFHYVQVDDLIQIPINKEETKGYFRQVWDSFLGKNPDSEMRKQFHKTLPVLFKYYIEFGMEQIPKNRILYFGGLLRGFFSSSSRVDTCKLPWDKLKDNKNSCKEVLENFSSLENYLRMFRRNIYHCNISIIGWNTANCYLSNMNDQYQYNLGDPSSIYDWIPTYSLNFLYML